MKRGRPEAKFHESLAEYLDWALPPTAFHSAIPLGFESEAERGRWHRKGARPGMPEHVIVYAGPHVDAPGGPVHAFTLWLELKPPRGRPSDKQRIVHAILRACGHHVAIVRSLDEVAKLLAGFGVPLRAKLT